MTVAELQSTLRAFEREAQRVDIETVRLRYREEKGLIYVKTFTVQAHFRPYRRRAAVRRRAS